MSKELEKYTINFINLKPGLHEFEFEVNDDFFNEFEHSLLKEAEAEVEITFDKRNETLFVLSFHITGGIKVKCNRCLDEFRYPINIKEDIIVKLSDKEESSGDDNVIVLPLSEHLLNVSSQIYELLTLSIPMRPLCANVDKECNKEMIKILDDMKSGKNNSEEEQTDPRWDQLKKLNNN